MDHSLTRYEKSVANKMKKGILYRKTGSCLGGNEMTQRYTNADLKISLYVRVHIKLIPWKFRLLNPENSEVIYL